MVTASNDVARCLWPTLKSRQEHFSDIFVLSIFSLHLRVDVELCVRQPCNTVLDSNYCRSSTRCLALLTKGLCEHVRLHIRAQCSQRRLASDLNQVYS